METVVLPKVVRTLSHDYHFMSQCVDTNGNVRLPKNSTVKVRVVNKLNKDKPDTFKTVSVDYLV